MKTSSLIIITLILLGFSINTLAEEEKPQDISGSVETFADEESDSNNSETDVVTGEDTSRINTDSEEDETSADNEDSENNMADGSKNPQDNASEDEDSSEESANNSEGLEDSTLTEDDNNENDGSDLANEDSDAESENDDVIVEAQDTNASTIADQVNKIDKINNQAYEGTLTREQVTEELRPINRKQNKKISHPDAKRGLVRITKDNVYVYATKNTPKNKAINVNFGQYSPTGLTNGEQAFSDLYDTGFMIQADKEHPIFKSSLGILSWKWGTGLMISQGNGVLERTGRTSLEGFTFVMMPNHIGAVYKAQFYDTQLLVPYVEGGAGYYTYMERRDDNDGDGIHKILGKLGGSAVAHYGGGVALNIMQASRSARRTLQRDYGISGFWLRGEFRALKGLKSSFDLSANVINIGITTEY